MIRKSFKSETIVVAQVNGVLTSGLAWGLGKEIWLQPCFSNSMVMHRQDVNLVLWGKTSIRKRNKFHCVLRSKDELPCELVF